MCAWRSRSPGMWHCVIGQVFLHVALKCQNTQTLQHSVTFQETLTLSRCIVETSDLQILAMLLSSSDQHLLLQQYIGYKSCPFLWVVALVTQVCSIISLTPAVWLVYCFTTFPFEFFWYFVCFQVSKDLAHPKINYYLAYASPTQPFSCRQHIACSTMLCCPGGYLKWVRIS
jgi:hypothetical protein